MISYLFFIRKFFLNIFAILKKTMYFCGIIKLKYDKQRHISYQF